MKSKLLSAAVATLFAATAGFASAGESVTLSSNQMDSVAAGAILSTTGGAAEALLGFATTASQTAAFQSYYHGLTTASSVALAAGLLPIAATAATSMIH